MAQKLTIFCSAKAQKNKIQKNKNKNKTPIIYYQNAHRVGLKNLSSYGECDTVFWPSWSPENTLYTYIPSRHIQIHMNKKTFPTN